SWTVSSRGSRTARSRSVHPGVLRRHTEIPQPAVAVVLCAAAFDLPLRPRRGAAAHAARIRGDRLCGFPSVPAPAVRNLRPIATLGAALFLFNTCFSSRMLIGHLTFHAFMLVPWLPLWLFGRGGPSWRERGLEIAGPPACSPISPARRSPTC